MMNSNQATQIRRLEDLIEEVDQARARAVAAERRMEFLAKSSAELASSLDFERTLKTIARLAVPAVADWCAVDLLDGSGELRRLAVEHTDPSRIEYVRRIQERYPPRLDSPYGAPQVIRTGRSEFVKEIPPELLTEVATDAEHLALIRRLGLRSYVVSPLSGRDGVMGAITFVYAESGRNYTDADRELVDDLARRAAVAIENALLVREIEEKRDQMEDQAAELEIQAEELESQTEELIETANALELAHGEKAALLEASGAGIYGIDQEGRCTFMNPAAAEALGWSQEEVLGRNMHELIHHHHPDGSEYPEEECPIYRAGLSGDGIRVGDEVLWRKDGSTLPVEYSSFPLLRNGERVGAVVSFIDLTDRKAAEAREQLFGRVLDESLNEIYIFDLHSLKFVSVNRGARENLGYSMDELREMTPLDIKPEFTPEEFEDRITPLRTGEQEMINFRTVHRRKDGSLYPVDINLQISRAGGAPVFVAVILDITERHAAEAERDRLIEQLEEANRAKSQFLANMSHELRTPLNAIAGYAELLDMGLRGPVTTEQRADLARIKRAQAHLLGLINDVLNYAKLESGRIEYQRDEIAVPAMLTAVTELLRPTIAEQGLSVTTSCEDADPYVAADEDRVRQILLNLLSNAVKFTDEGGAIEVACEATDGTVQIRVSDTGVGIATDQLEHIFEPFVQVSSDLTRLQSGTGLGLAISREMARAMGGNLTAESELGEGSTFVLTLPAATRSRDD